MKTDNRSKRVARLGPLALVAVIVLQGPAACSESASETSNDAPTQALETITYSVRGIVAELPDPNVPTATLKVRHEPMPHYKRDDGTLGMNAMTMPFPPGPELSLAGIEVGQKVLLTFEVDYLEIPDSDRMRITAFRATDIEVLPPATELSFENPVDSGGD